MFALLLYRIVLILFLPVILLFILLRSKNNSGYRQRLLERFGFFSKNLTSHQSIKNGIVIHAASVGEVIALKPLVEQLLSNFPNIPITFTTFTPTGSEQVKKLFSTRVQHCYLPFDLYPCTQLFLFRLQPQLVIFMETELWPNLIAQCKHKNIKLLLVNGRLSAKSINSYQKITALISPALNSFNKILIQSNDNLERFIALGANRDICTVAGNIKFDLSISPEVKQKSLELKHFLPTNRPIWLVASTHEGDELIALSAFDKIKKTIPDLLLILVPRHPERFSPVQRLCTDQNFSVILRSENTAVVNEDIWLLDSLGELMSVFNLADIVTMGGSFNKVGGHNPLEPALFKKPIIVGNNMSNFVEITKLLKEKQGIVQLTCSKELASTVTALLKHPEKRQRLGNNAYDMVIENQGACQNILNEIQTLLPHQETKYFHQKNIYCGYNSAIVENFSIDYFNPQYWQSNNAITGSAQGRGTTWFIRTTEKDTVQHWVLKHYYRGGLIGKLIKDHYWFTSLQATRTKAEFDLLTHMRHQNLPVPKPIAYQIIKKGLFYQADILSGRINNAQDLVAILSQHSIPSSMWQKIGQTIKRFHDRGIYHHDLNAHNILLTNTNDAVYLIDFDRGELRNKDNDQDVTWKKQNVSRLHRSFTKELNRIENFHWQEQYWQLLLAGYSD